MNDMERRTIGGLILSLIATGVFVLMYLATIEPKPVYPIRITDRERVDVVERTTHIIGEVEEVSLSRVMIISSVHDVRIDLIGTEMYLYYFETRSYTK